MDEATHIKAVDAVAFLAPAGYHIALRVGFAFPEFEQNTYPAAWADTYTRRGYMLDDPVMRWIYRNTGAIRWSTLAANDPRGILADAADHGLTFGAAVCLSHDKDTSLRSFGSFARSDREFTDDELRSLIANLQGVDRDVRPENLLTRAEQEAFRLLGEGRMLKEIAFELGISESAVKQRLTNGRGKLSARTNMQAVMDATRLGWLD
ncbi:Transcriptional activator protein LuxR [Rhodobacteraceae bacterium THAF1]|uniref:helix-turn-helix transcriptional regulator n=1 Tax=Palleronia sp. THAF1 TaxID=2587842 RepID=UPI000F3B854B|nr:LuxR family transcriptional regulator [Palleronia sp. THAF1]QFU10052.1 Transcriptional activator protein LuxR [Palleronia sp. THAF1]VDC17043.1 Transcriptional activator protein LuxR [Rhodobacteraceae bacterium THAF1]